MFEALQGTTPAVAGLVLLGRPAPGQVLATAVDLAARGELRVEHRKEGWVTHPRPDGHRPAGRQQANDTSTFEKALLAWMFPVEGPFLPTELNEQRVAALAPVIDRMMDELCRRRLARTPRRLFRRGPFDRGIRLTERGEQLATRLRDTRIRLRRAEALPPHRMRGLLGHLMVLGLGSEQRLRAAPPGLLGLVGFVSAWHASCVELPGWLPPAPAKAEFEPLGPSAPGTFEPGNPLLGGMADGD